MSDKFITNECRVCKHELPRPLYTVNQCELETCVNCGFVQVKDVPDGEILNGLYSEAYFDRGKYVDDLAVRYEFKRRLKMLAKQGLFKDAKLLDFGGGTGEFLHGVYGQKRRWSKTRRAALGTQRTFFWHNKTRMNYAVFRRQGLPVGSGPVEADCKTLVKTHLCRSGMRWSWLGGQRKLQLRTYVKSDCWEAFRKQYKQRWPDQFDRAA